MPKIVIEVTLDPVPGKFHELKDFLEIAEAGHAIPDYYVENVSILPETSVLVLRRKSGLVIHGIFTDMQTAKTSVDNFREQLPEFAQQDFVYFEVPTDTHANKPIQT